MIKKPSLKTLFCGLAVSVLIGGTALATDYNGYDIYNFQANNSTPAHAKYSNDDYISNYVSSITGYIQNVDFWAEDAGGTELSNTYVFSVGSEANILFKSGVNKSIGDSVKMTMQNDNFAAYTGTVSGTVSFR